MSVTEDLSNRSGRPIRRPPLATSLLSVPDRIGDRWPTLPPGDMPPCCIEFCCPAQGTLPDEKIRRPAVRIRKSLVELVRSDPLNEPGDFAVPRGFEIGDLFVPGFLEEGVQCRSEPQPRIVQHPRCGLAAGC